MKTSTKTFAIADTAANADYLTNTSEPLGETMTLNVGPPTPPPTACCAWCWNLMVKKSSAVIRWLAICTAEWKK